jgi:hypothetical protein
MEFKRKITKINIDGYGDYYVRAMTIGARQRHKAIQAEISDSSDAYNQIQLETVVDCLVDSNGNQLLKDVAELVASNPGMDLFNAWSSEILKVSSSIHPGNPETNLGKAPNSSSPSN